MKNKLNAKLCNVLCALICLIAAVLSMNVNADAKDLDEILRYEITVDVRDDAKLNIRYLIEWKVLDSTLEGPLEWVKIGIPNNHAEGFKALTDNISSVRYLYDEGTYARVDFDREYKAGEVVTFEFELIQDYMYQVDKLKEGQTVYEFTPGWFDGINVDSLVVRWNAGKVEAFSPANTREGDYLVWNSSLSKGQKFNISVTYNNDAYAFDLSKEIVTGDDSFPWGVVVFFAVVAVIFILIWFAAESSQYSSTANFSSKTKIVRTKVVYYSSCPSCGSPRTGESENCRYCGASYIKSEEKISEKDIPAEEKELRSKKTEGLYRYSSSPNTYVRVHVTHVPVPHVYSSTRSSSGGSSRSSCAHSSCACACACACAGGGRAGCTVKDFYNTDLKLKQLEYRKKRG